MGSDRGKSWELTGLGGQSFNGTGNLFDPWVHHRTLFKPSENSWELAGHGCCCMSNNEN